MAVLEGAPHAIAQPLARIVGYAQAEVEPKWLFLALIQGVCRLLERIERGAKTRLIARTRGGWLEPFARNVPMIWRSVDPSPYARRVATSRRGDERPSSRSSRSSSLTDLRSRGVDSAAVLEGRLASGMRPIRRPARLHD